MEALKAARIEVVAHLEVRGPPTREDHERIDEMADLLTRRMREERR